MLRSGAWFDFCAPASSNFTIDDIAHGLANICRYSGQCRDFYSVAEHSILVSETAKSFEFEALLHDAAEAFIGDITRPLKQLLPEYKKIEANVQRAILDRFGVLGPIPPQVKQSDLRVLAAEQSRPDLHRRATHEIFQLSARTRHRNPSHDGCGEPLVGAVVIDRNCCGAATTAQQGARAGGRHAAARGRGRGGEADRGTA